MMHDSQTQSGATLAVALIMLLMLTVIGTAAMQTTVTEERMSTHMQDKELAFQSAESALAEAEAWIMSQTSKPIPEEPCSAQPCVLTNDPDRNPGDQDNIWWIANSALFGSSTIAGVIQQPRYVIEYNRFIPDDLTMGHSYSTPGVDYYRVTSRGLGGSISAETILETTVARRF